MSIWAELGSSLLKGLGYTVGAKVGKDLYDAVSKRLDQLDRGERRRESEPAGGETGEEEAGEPPINDFNEVQRTL